MQVIACIVIVVSARCDVDEENIILMLCPTWVVVWVLFYPVFAWRRYSDSVGYYRKHGISRIAYLFGKRMPK